MRDSGATVCWSASGAAAVLQIEALATNRPAFLAVHQPIRDFDVAGARGHEIAHPSDEDVLAALVAPENRHAFCVVEGEPGSGKSHLIRWLATKWPSADLVLLVQRADGSLIGTLRELQAALGPRYGRFFDRLGQRLDTTFEGRVGTFHAVLAQTLRPKHFSQPPPDAEWCGQWDVGPLIGHQVVQERWAGPGRILSVMAGLNGERDQESARFNLFDVADLGRLQSAVDKNLPPKAVMLLRQIAKEAERLAPARAEGQSADDLMADAEDRFPNSFKLVQALNRRRDAAVQTVLGISVDGLRQMFLDLRAELRKAEPGRRLVLLLEDVTSWEGIDSQLIDALVTDARTRPKDDLCDLISVVGMTPAYVRDLRANYEQRITHQIRLGREADGGGRFQRTLQLATEPAQLSFAANYLRAARIPADALDAWHEAGADPRSIPNACVPCALRAKCHAAFGAVDGVGLYPFTPRAVINLFGSLRDPEGKMTLQTPRGMIQGVLSPILLRPANLEDGRFPSAEVEANEWLPADLGHIPTFLERLVAAREPEPADRERLRRLLAYWGTALDRAETTAWESEGRAFAGIPEGVFAAFGLPWIGEDAVAAPPTPATTPVSPPSIAPAPPPDEPQPRPRSSAEVEAKTEQPAPAGEGRVTGASAKPAKTGTDGARRTTPSAGELRRRQGQIRQWKDLGRLEDPTFWQDALVAIMQQVPRARFGIPKGLWDSLFTSATVRLEGVSKPDVRHFVLPKADWVIDGLDAYVGLRTGEELPPAQEEYYRRRYARLLRRLGEAASEHAERRVQGGGSWRPAALIAQVLLSRAWLRGTARPDQPLHDQFLEVMGDERPAVGRREDRVDSWGELLDKSDHYQDRLRRVLRPMLSLAQGDGRGSLVDAGEVAQALTELSRSLTPAPVPDVPSQALRGLEDLIKVAELARETADRLRHIPDRESKRLADRTERLLALLRRHGIRAHVQRVEKVLADLTVHFPSSTASEVTAWARLRDRLFAGLLEDGDAVDALEEYLLRELDLAEARPAAEVLADVLQAPAGQLAALLEAAEAGEMAIEKGHAYVRVFLATETPAGQLETVTGLGGRLGRAAYAVRQALEAGDA